jgi:hypothetical protein
MSTTFYPNKTAPIIYDCMFLILNKVYFNMVLYLYLHLHIGCNDLHPNFKIHVWDSSSAWQCRLMLWSSGLWHHSAWYMNINIISVAFLCQITAVRSSLQHGIKFTIWSMLLPQYDSEQFSQHTKKSYKFINSEGSLPRCVDQLYNQKIYITYMVRLYYKLNQQLYNMCVG